MTGEAKEILLLLETIINNQKSRAGLTPYTANVSLNLTTVNGQNQDALNKEKEDNFSNFDGQLLKALKQETLPEESMEKVRSVYSNFKNKPRNGLRFTPRQKTYSTS